MGDALSKALAKGSLTGADPKPFHIRVRVTEPENPDSPYQGTIEEWWLSPDQWRRELTAKGGMRQTIVVVRGKKTEQDEGDYFPHWLQEFVTAIVDPVPDADHWSASGAVIEQIVMPNGEKSDACARAKSKIGDGDNAVDAFSNVCFDGEGRLGSVGSPGYFMEFHDYRKFDKKQIAHTLANDPEPGTRLVGSVTVLEDEAKATAPSFTPLQPDEERFRSVQVGSAVMRTLTADEPPIIWPPVRSGNIKGKLAMYISVDRTGQVREAWPLNSDNAGLEDPAREQVRKWKFKAAVDQSGKAVQVKGGLGFTFETRIDNPLPILSNAQIRELATKIVEPVWPASGLQHGQIVLVEISVNEEGKLTGSSYSKTPPAALRAVNDAIRKWSFRPLIRDEKPQYFHGTLEFVVP
jgi:TonB family protein